MGGRADDSSIYVDYISLGQPKRGGITRSNADVVQGLKIEACSQGQIFVELKGRNPAPGATSIDRMAE